MTRLTVAVEWLIYPLLAVLLLGPGLYLFPSAIDPFRSAGEILVVTAAWGVTLLVAVSSTLRGLPLFGFLQRSWTLRLGMFFMAWVAVGWAFSYNHSAALTHGFMVLSFLLMGGSLVEWVERDVRRRGHLLAAIAVVLGLQGLLALSQLMHFPWPAIAEAVKTPWLQGALQAISAPSKAGVAIGTFGNPNYLAEFIVLTLPAVGAWVALRRGWLRVVGAIGLVVVLVALIATGTRAALLGLIVGSVVAAVVVWGKAALDPRPLWKDPRSRIGVVLGAILVFAVVGVAGNRLASKLSNVGQPDAAIEARLVNWGVGVELWKERPLTGAGLGTYKLMNVEKMMAVHPDGAPEAAWKQRFLQLHNEPLQLLVETGLVGTLLVFGAFAFWFRETRRNAALDDRLKFGLLAGVSAILVAGFFGFPFHVSSTAVAIVFMLALGLAAETPATSEHLSTWRPAYAVVAAMLIVIVAGQGLTKLVWPLKDGFLYEELADQLRDSEDRASAAVVYGLSARHQRFKAQAVGQQARMLFADRKYAEIVELYDQNSHEGLNFGMDYYKARALFRLGRVDEAKVLFEKVAKFCKKDSTQGRGSIRFLNQIEAAEKNSATQPKPEPAKVGAGR